MKIGEEYKDCHYWGYEPASAEFLFTNIDREKKHKLREQYKAERAKLKASGYKTVQMGFHTLEAAKEDALKVETATGIEMRVFNHDYL